MKSRRAIQINKQHFPKLGIVLAAGFHAAFAQDTGDNTAPPAPTEESSPAPAGSSPTTAAPSDSSAVEGLLQDLQSSPAASSSSSPAQPAESSAPAVAADTSTPAEVTAEPATTTEAAVYDKTIPVNLPDTKAEPAPVDNPRTPPQHLEEIVVTATKREVSVRDIPVTINVLSGEQLEKMGAHDVHDYLALTPGITLQDGLTGDVQSRNITIRGVGSAPLTNQAVGQFIGDIPMTDPYSNYMTPDLDPFDLKTVEVLKGPQGTYFGASALNGAIRYVPNVPDLGAWNGRVYVDYLSVNQGSAAPSFGGALNIPIGETFALRGMGVIQRAPGVIDNLQQHKPDNDSRRKWSGRGAARWQPTDDLAINLMYLKQASHTNDVLPVDNPNGELTNNSHPGPSRVDSGFSLASADIRYDLGDAGTLVAQGSRQTKKALYDTDGGISTFGNMGIQSLRGYLNADITGTTGEVRLVSPESDKWKWIVGAFGLNYVAHITTDLYLANSAPLGVLSGLPIVGTAFDERGLSLGGQVISPLRATEYAIYGELSRKFWDDWELTVGTRFYKTHEDGKIHSIGGTAALVGDFPVDLRDHGISPKVSLAYRANENISAYATISRGFQFGGVNASTSLLPADNPVTGTPTPPTFKSSTLWNREIGIRTDWLDRTLRADLTYFNLDWSDAQFNQTQSNLLLLNTFVSNVGKVKSQGFESSVNWLTPISGLSFNLSGAYTLAKTQVAFTTGDNKTIPVGTQMPATPLWQTAATASYMLVLGNWVSTATFTDTYSGKAYNDIQHSHEIYDANLMNFDLSIARPDLVYAPALSVSVNNLADKRELVGYTNGTSIINDLSYYNRPRTISIRFTAEFK